tara:strand:- start:1821 stop:2279 length:459 start_codon:yes stop_codon:yes gene_type:complete
MLTINPYYQGIEKELFDIFRSAITQICSKDYSEEQIKAWAPAQYDHAKWKQRIDAIEPFVAVLDGEVVGYADIQKDGYIDHFFVSGNFQSKGVGKALMSRLLTRRIDAEKAYSNVSITARPFFEKHGFKVVKENCVLIRGIALSNFTMERNL